MSLRVWLAVVEWFAGYENRMNAIENISTPGREEEREREPKGER